MSRLPPDLRARSIISLALPDGTVSTEGSRSETDLFTAVLLGLSIAVLLSYALAFGDLVRAYPTWVYVSSVTVPTVVVAPTGLSLAVLAKAVLAYRDGNGRVGSPVVTLLAAVTAGASGYALIELNTGRGGVFWAGIPVVAFGGILAAVVLVSEALRRIGRESSLTSD